MNCIIIDDEPLAIDLIEAFVLRIPFLNLSGRFTSAYEAMKILRSNKADLIFLDIQMPHLNGIEFVKSLDYKPLVIFTTAFSNFALEGFELDVVDYLVKPIEFSRFLKAVNKAYNMRIPKPGESFKPAAVKNSDNMDYMMIKVEHSTVRIDFNSILYIEGLKDYVKIFNGSRPVLTKSTMKNVESKLPPDRFTRVHKSYIVSLSKIESIENNRILITEKRIPVGNEFKQSFHDIINRLRL